MTERSMGTSTSKSAQVVQQEVVLQEVVVIKEEVILHKLKEQVPRRSLLEVIDGQYPGMMDQQRQKVAGMSDLERRLLSRSLGLH